MSSLSVNKTKSHEFFMFRSLIDSFLCLNRSILQFLKSKNEKYLRSALQNACMHLIQF